MSMRINIPKKVAKVSSKPLFEETETLNWNEKMNNAIEDLSENKSSSREESLEALVDAFATHLVSSHIEDRLEDILGLLKRSLLKSGNTQEVCLAAKAIGLTFVNMVDVTESEADDLYRRILPSLKNVIKDSEVAESKIACLETLALISYTAASDADKQLVRDYIFDLIETDGADYNVEELSSEERDHLFGAALQAYGILFAASFTSGLVDFDTLWEELEKVMPMHEMLLESSDKDVRIAAGENIGLMFETANIFLASDSDEESDDNIAKPEYDNMDGLVHTLKDLSMDSNRRRAKSDRAEQKSVFRDVVKSVEENVRPEETVKFSGRTYTFKGWAKILPLNAFRNILGPGFLHHLKTNNMMQAIFHYTAGFRQADSDDSGEDDDYQLSNVDRKYLHDENKKSRSKQLRNARLNKDVAPTF